MDSHIKVAEALVQLLDNKFHFLGLRFGLDPLLGLIPGIGDFISAVISFYLVWIGVQMKMPKEKINEMIQHIITDFILGVIPIVGDVSDFVYKANEKNLKILKEYAAIIEGQLITK